MIRDWKDYRNQINGAVGEIRASNPDLVKAYAAFHQFEQAQGQLTGALSRLLVVSEQYPDLKATANFRDLQAELAGTENRISVERMRFNEAAQAFNTARDSFPTVVVAKMFGHKFAEKAYFQSQAGAATAPKVQF